MCRIMVHMSFIVQPMGLIEFLVLFSIFGVFSCYLALTGRRKLRLCLPPAISRVFFITSDDVVENLRVERVDNKEGQGRGNWGTGGTPPRTRAISGLNQQF